MQPPQGNNEFALLVEGEDDKHFVQHIDKKLNLNLPTSREFIFDSGGFPQILKVLRVQIKVPGRKAIGIMVDANSDLVDRWKSLKEELKNEGIEIPPNPKIGGTIIKAPSNQKPRTGIWIMPDNNSNGELEDFVIQMIPKNDSVWPLAESYIDGIPSNSRKFRSSKIRRAKLYAWLSTREMPSRMGLAVTKGDLDLRGKLTKQFADWLTKMFK